MDFSGKLRKMQTRLEDGAHYTLVLDGSPIDMKVIDADLVATKASLTDTLDADLRQFIDTDDTVCSINYPVDRYPEKVKSVGFDKQAQIEGCLAGIKGQYLIFDDNRVLNIRKHNGYRVSIS